MDRLGWAAGLSLAPHGLKIGIRTSDLAGLEVLRHVITSLGYQPTVLDEVHLLYSLRIGNPAKRGRRHFHLLYMGAAQLARSLDLDEVVAILTDSLRQMLQIQANGGHVKEPHRDDGTL